MLSKLKKTNNKGFTIIEVMIVLAIVGLIMLIVFLAVPALQRNSRNTQRKNDASSVAGALSTYISNSNGLLPNATGIKNSVAGEVTFCDVAACGAATKVQETAKLGYFDTAQEFMGTTPAAGTTYTATTTVQTSYSATNVDKDSVMINLKGTCDTTTLGKVNYNARSAAIIYVTEAANGAGTVQCLEQ
jgi:prepilin-type N-terminal cleavage/methylation domain-containing protein